jgi:hypothetical protein
LLSFIRTNGLKANEISSGVAVPEHKTLGWVYPGTGQTKDSNTASTTRRPNSSAEKRVTEAAASTAPAIAGDGHEATDYAAK